MTNKFELFEKFRTINYNSLNNIYKRENDDILSNLNNNSIHFTYTNKNVGINTLIKPFELLFGQDYSEMNLNIDSIDLTSLHLDKDFMSNNNKKDNNKENNKDHNKVISYKFKIKKAKKKKSKQSLNEIGKKIFTIKKIMKLGRIKKNSSKRGKHDKYKIDNNIRRFKVHLMKSMNI